LRLVEDKNYFVCQYCTSLHFPEENIDGVRALEELSDHDCPVCHTLLTTGSIEKQRMLYCPRCAGVLLKQRTFAAFVQLLRARSAGRLSAPPPLNASELEREIDCPSCGARMETFPYLGPGNVVIDNCFKCKVIWLDYGELHRIINTL
jgi:Zn-finger nucleic acid-binding protein